MPRLEDDFNLAAKNSWVVALDNLSSIPDWLSDSLCRCSTGGGVSKRKHYSNTGEVLFKLQRPQIVNGIEELATKGDLVSRSLMLELMPIDSDQRRTEREYWAAFEGAQGAIFSAVLDAVSTAIRNLDQTEVSDAPRLADFCQWVQAASPALHWEPDRFERAYRDNREAGTRIALEASPFVPYLIDIVKTGSFSGTASKLLAALTTRAQPGEQYSANGLRRRSTSATP